MVPVIIISQDSERAQKYSSYLEKHGFGPIHIFAQKQRQKIKDCLSKIKQEAIVFDNAPFIDQEFLSLLAKNKSSSILALCLSKNFSTTPFGVDESNYLKIEKNSKGSYFCSNIAKLSKNNLSHLEEMNIEGIFTHHLESNQQCLGMTLPLRDFDKFDKKNAAIFLDRDGVIIEDEGYVGSIDRCQLSPEIVPFLKWAQSKNYLIISLTNQSGIAKGLYSEKDYQNVTQHIDKLLHENSVKINKWYHASYHPDESYNGESSHPLFRKPEPGMLLKALEENPITLKGSFMIGDKDSDVLKFPYINYYLLKGSYTLSEDKYKNIIFNNLLEIKKVEGP